MADWLSTPKEFNTFEGMERVGFMFCAIGFVGVGALFHAIIMMSEETQKAIKDIDDKLKKRHEHEEKRHLTEAEEIATLRMMDDERQRIVEKIAILQGQFSKELTEMKEAESASAVVLMAKLEEFEKHREILERAHRAETSGIERMAADAAHALEEELAMLHEKNRMLLEERDNMSKKNEMLKKDINTLIKNGQRCPCGKFYKGTLEGTLHTTSVLSGHDGFCQDCNQQCVGQNGPEGSDLCEGGHRWSDCPYNEKGRRYC